MNREQKTIKKIQELVPEIMELKFGCKYLFTDLTASKGYVKQREKICDSGDYKIENGVGYFMSNTQWLKMDKIIGRDITLEDVLLTIKEKHKNDDDFSYELEAFKQLLFTSFENWQLNKPFHSQSQETKDFIGDLILTK